MDRTQRCVERDKNRPSVVIWSMGNECAYGCTFEEALRWTKKFDSTRLTHYESSRYVSDKRKYDYSVIDLQQPGCILLWMRSVTILKRTAPSLL